MHATRSFGATKLAWERQSDGNMICIIHWRNKWFVRLFRKLLIESRFAKLGEWTKNCIYTTLVRILPRLDFRVGSAPHTNFIAPQSAIRAQQRSSHASNARKQIADKCEIVSAMRSERQRMFVLSKHVRDLDRKECIIFISALEQTQSRQKQSRRGAANRLTRPKAHTRCTGRDSR